jgi:hypothetical protein
MWSQPERSLQELFFVNGTQPWRERRENVLSRPGSAKNNGKRRGKWWFIVGSSGSYWLIVVNTI